MILRFVMASMLCLGVGSALAHKASDAYLGLQVSGDGRTMNGQWDIALRDLELAVGVDLDRDGSITWGELEAARPSLESHALSRLVIRQGGRDCASSPKDLLFDRHTDGGYAVLRFDVECPRRIDEIEIDYRLLFDIDRQHKGLLKFEASGNIRSAVFSVDQGILTVRAAEISAWNHFADYTLQGIWHIWIGFDHILFLLALLLPAVLVVEAATHVPVRSFRAGFIDVLKIVTAFTVAHSVTLTAATLEWVALPSRLVESAIALSVVLAALNNVVSTAGRRRWPVAFAFGLVHGFGFASVLADLGLPGDSLLVALLGFNVGVEIGQLAIVAAFLPLAFVMRATPFYKLWVFRGGSIAIALLAGLWFVERAFDLKLVPF